MNAKTAGALLALVLPCAASAAPVDVDAWAKPVDAKVLQWRRDFHQFPELGNREFRTSKIVAAHLRSLGLEVTTGVAHTGVTAVLKGGKPGPRIALRADMDALPVTENSGLPFQSKQVSEFRGEKVGVMHACGHDSHTAILMGVAEAMAKHRAELSGDVLFVFQPAEEGPPDGETGGASQMLAEGIFKTFKPEAVFGLHVFSTLNAGQVGYRSGPLMAASDRFNIVIKGRQTHGSRPWGGIDPIVAAAEVVTSAQTVVSRRQNLTKQPIVLSFGAIKGGIRYNIIPDSVELIGTIRSFDNDMRDQAFKDLENVAQHVAAAHGATAISQIPDKVGNPVTVNNPALTAQVLPSLRKAAGADNVVEMTLTTGAEDFAYYANEVPGFFYFVGATPKGQDPNTAPSNHSPQFFLDESALPLGTRTLLQVAVDYLNKAE
ncbi:N-acyl-L-amino acid amidohydrolase [Arenimonas maotaiensis]|uniref:N-acyl-L-amino acid amidohydrolase n=1 Tax=Arenimonas maotaiensis TaxID=1446479 RepID=A0A917CR89_9GAMM|nr:amidohydrolase [Arenimonas maotaiensis]GGF94681.1 N-acyl-L-amino acid amidohydrolase [Arenimonas maotaiensis]